MHKIPKPCGSEMQYVVAVVSMPPLTSVPPVLPSPLSPARREYSGDRNSCLLTRFGCQSGQSFSSLEAM